MEFSSKSNSNFLLMDYDSGYISHNQESNSDCSMENLHETNVAKNFSSKPIFISEDALQEKPDVTVKELNISAEIAKEDYEETRTLFNSPEIITGSVETEKSNLSGFTNDSSVSNVSLEIPVVAPIVVNENFVYNNDDSAFDTLEHSANNSFEDNTDVNVQPQNVIQKNVLNNLTNIIEKPSNDLVENYKEKSSNDVKLSPKTLEENKENIYIEKKVKAKTPRKQYKNTVDPNLSPDLFDGEESVFYNSSQLKEPEMHTDFIAEEKYIIKKDRRILKRVQNGLNGVLPPPSVTIMQLSVVDILRKLEQNKKYFWTNPGESGKSHNSSDDNVAAGESKSLLVTVAGIDDFSHKKFPQTMVDRFHGLHFNRSKVAEEFEQLCDKFAQRCVGAETQSTCTVFDSDCGSPSTSRKRSIKNRWTAKSPGRRLSHLARRRITFSSASLLQGGNGSSLMAGTRSRQILVDSRSRRKSPGKSPRKTPKKTPAKSPRCKARTPSSSAKKKLAMRFRKLTGEFEKSVPSTSSDSYMVNSKRALFQSPEKSDKKNSSLFLPSTSGFHNDLKKGPPKRALFLSPRKNSPRKNSPYKKSPFKTAGFEKKRKRSESDDQHLSKLPRSMSLDMRPSSSETSKVINRSKSDMPMAKAQSSQSTELSAIHKKKLQWAVYEALRTQNVTTTHPQFKVFASVLARVTRRFLPNLSANAPRPEGGTSERMLRIARCHVYAVVKGKSVDEIINEYLKNKLRIQKPQGYIGIEEFKKLNTIAIDKVPTGDAEKKKLESLGKPKSESKVDRIRKVINFGDDNR